MDEKKEYKNILLYVKKLKTPFNFGITQVTVLIISIVKNKVILLWIGPSGLGLISLLNNALNLLTIGTNFGLSTSLVKEVSSEKEGRKQNLLDNSFKLSLLISFFGCLLTFVFSGFLAEYTFNDVSLKWMFQWLSISVFFKQLATCIRAILQGLEHYKSIVLSSLFFSVIGFAITLPLYYCYREKSIIPSIIILSFIELISIIFFIKNVFKINFKNISINDFISFSRKTINKGLVFSLISALNLLVNYLLGIYILNNSDLNVYGYYSAIYIIVNNYIGLIFTVFSYDYLPKLVKVEASKLNKLLNEQIFIVTSIVSVISIVSLLFAELIIKILYGNSYLNLVPVFKLALLGMAFKAVSWCISYVILAKSSRKTYFWLEFISNILFITFSVIGFYFFDSNGLWIAWVLYYFLYLVAVYVIARKNFQISIKRNLFLILGSNFVIYLIYFLLR